MRVAFLGQGCGEKKTMPGTILMKTEVQVNPSMKSLS